MSLGHRIKDLRLKRGLTQEELADKLGMKRPNFANYEADRTTPPSDILSSLSDLLHTSTDYLLGKTNNPFPANSEEKDYVDAIDLGDEELIEKFKLEIDGRILTKEEAKLAASFLRTIRQQKK